jgi:Lipopolysaccharide-assembly
VAWVLGLLLLGGGCGYHVNAAGGELPKGVEKVYVPIFRNQTTEAGLETWITDELRRDLDRSGYLGGAASDGRVEGRLEAVFVGPLALKVGPSTPVPQSGGRCVGCVPENPGVYRATVTVSMKLVLQDGRVTDFPRLSRSEDFLQADDLATMEANRRLALHRAGQQLAQDIATQLTSGW